MHLFTLLTVCLQHGWLEIHLKLQLIGFLLAILAFIIVFNTGEHDTRTKTSTPHVARNCTCPCTRTLTHTLALYMPSTYTHIRFIIQLTVEEHMQTPHSVIGLVCIVVTGKAHSDSMRPDSVISPLSSPLLPFCLTLKFFFSFSTSFATLWPS